MSIPNIWKITDVPNHQPVLEGLVSVVSTAYRVGLAQVSYAIRIIMKNGMQPMHLPGKNGELYKYTRKILREAI